MNWFAQSLEVVITKGCALFFPRHSMKYGCSLSILIFNVCWSETETCEHVYLYKLRHGEQALVALPPYALSTIRTKIISWRFKFGIDIQLVILSFVSYYSLNHDPNLHPKEKKKKKKMKEWKKKKKNPFKSLDFIFAFMWLKNLLLSFFIYCKFIPTFLQALHWRSLFSAPRQCESQSQINLEPLLRLLTNSYPFKPIIPGRTVPEVPPTPAVWLASLQEQLKYPLN